MLSGAKQLATAEATSTLKWEQGAWDLGWKVGDVLDGLVKHLKELTCATYLPYAETGKSKYKEEEQGTNNYKNI